ncbi:MAG: hypothetical protein K8T91_22025 [Planctomycetes bacterium]|nr:hypothetical protein [Planctomycetota bacterium]
MILTVEAIEQIMPRSWLLVVAGICFLILSSLTLGGGLWHFGQVADGGCFLFFWQR